MAIGIEGLATLFLNANSNLSIMKCHLFASCQWAPRMGIATDHANVSSDPVSQCSHPVICDLGSEKIVVSPCSL